MSFNENTDNMLVVTIGIQMHAGIIAGDLEPGIKKIFENVRLLSKSAGFNLHETCVAEEFLLSGSLNNLFRKNIETSTYNMISNINGLFLADISFDKLLTTDDNWFQGIFLVSIHKGKKLIYPNASNATETINLLDISNLKKLADEFGTEVPKLQGFSTSLPNSLIYIEEEKRIEEDTSIPTDEKEIKIKEIRDQLYSYINKWSLTLNNLETKIQSIKLSVLVEILKIIINQPCIINLLDYSCSILPEYKYTDTSNWTMPDRSDDIETGVNPGLGGKKRKVFKKKYTKKRVGFYKKIKNKTNKKKRIKIKNKK